MVILPCPVIYFNDKYVQRQSKYLGFSAWCLFKYIQIGVEMDLIQYIFFDDLKLKDNHSIKEISNIMFFNDSVSSETMTLMHAIS